MCRPHHCMGCGGCFKGKLACIGSASNSAVAAYVAIALLRGLASSAVVLIRGCDGRQICTQVLLGTTLYNKFWLTSDSASQCWYLVCITYLSTLIHTSVVLQGFKVCGSMSGYGQKTPYVWWLRSLTIQYCLIYVFGTTPMLIYGSIPCTASHL